MMESSCAISRSSARLARIQRLEGRGLIPPYSANFESPTFSGKNFQDRRDLRGNPQQREHRAEVGTARRMLEDVDLRGRAEPRLGGHVRGLLDDRAVLEE